MVREVISPVLFTHIGALHLSLVQCKCTYITPKNRAILFDPTHCSACNGRMNEVGDTPDYIRCKVEALPYRPHLSDSQSIPSSVWEVMVRNNTRPAVDKQTVVSAGRRSNSHATIAAEEYME